MADVQVKVETTVNGACGDVAPEVNVVPKVEDGGGEVVGGGTQELAPTKIKRLYKCGHEPCTFSTVNPREFLYHRREVHGEKLKIAECPKCQYACQYTQKLQRHILLMHDQVRPPRTAVKRSAQAATPTPIPSTSTDVNNNDAPHSTSTATATAPPKKKRNRTKKKPAPTPVDSYNDAMVELDAFVIVDDDLEPSAFLSEDDDEEDECNSHGAEFYYDDSTDMFHSVGLLEPNVQYYYF